MFYREYSELLAHKSKMDNLSRRMQKEKVNIRVHDVLIRGNTRTKDWLIEAELKPVKSAATMKELIEAAQIAKANLEQLGIFDSIGITLDSGPPELPGTANVIVEVVETNRPLKPEFHFKATDLKAMVLGIYKTDLKAMARPWTAEVAVKYKNGFGYGDSWGSSFKYGLNGLEATAGVHLPRLKGLLSPVFARVSLHTQDSQEFSSYKEELLGLSLGLLSTRNHSLEYKLGWRTLTDPSQMSSRSVRRQLGHSFLSSLNYTYKIDKRDSPLRPTTGYAFASTTQLGGLAPDRWGSRFLRQEFDLRYAVPFGFSNAALNFGISGGVLFPWGHKPSPLPEKFFIGGNFSPVTTMGGPPTLWGFSTMGLCPTEPRRQSASGRDFIGGDLAITAFADLSFDLPTKWLKENGVHGHIFAGAGNLSQITKNEFRNFSYQKFMDSSQISVGAGIVASSLEGNIHYTLNQRDRDGGKFGFGFSFCPRS